MQFLIMLGTFLGLLIPNFAIAQIAQPVKVLPSGNRYSEQPDIPSSSTRRAIAKGTSFNQKYQKIKKLLNNDKILQNNIKSISQSYRIDPIHIVGALVGEHTFNIDVYDTFQSYLVKVAHYTNIDFAFEHDNEKVTDFIKRREFKSCENFDDSYTLWSCREHIWQTRFSDKEVDGKKYPKNRFSAVFFQPFYAGQTFGFGQINPLTALKLTDKVNTTTKHEKINADDPGSVYKAIMDPHTTLTYIAASIHTAIEVYKKTANIDISNNPGITATLYNLGNPNIRAQAFKTSGRKFPRENYYGWFVNKNEDELRDIIAKW